MKKFLLATVLTIFAITGFAPTASARRGHKGGDGGPLLSPDEASGEVFEKNKLLSKESTLGLAGYRVLFMIEDGASAVSGGGQGAKASIGIKLTGIPQSMLQDITEEAYADFKQRLAKTGRVLLPAEKITGNAAFKALTPLKSPFDKDSNNYVVSEPAELPLVSYAHDAFDGFNALSQGPTKALYNISAENKAVLFVPTVMVHFCRVQSSGHSNFSMHAEVKVDPDLRIAGKFSSVSTYWADNPRHPSLGQGAIAGMKNGFQLDTTVGEVKTVSSEHSNLGLFDSSPWRSAKGTYEYFIANPARYKAEVLKGLFAFNESLAQAIAEAK